MDTGDERTELHQFSITASLKNKTEVAEYVGSLLPEVDDCMSITITNLGKSEGFSVATVIYASLEDIEKAQSYVQQQTT